MLPILYVNANSAFMATFPQGPDSIQSLTTISDSTKYVEPAENGCTRGDDLMKTGFMRRDPNSTSSLVHYE